MNWTTTPQAGPIEHNNPPEVTAEVRDATILAWRQSREVLAAAKETEMKLRKQVSDMLFPNAGKGTHRYDLGNGYGVKLAQKFNYKLDRDRTEDALDKIEAISADPVEKALFENAVSRLVKFTPELSQTEYKLLDPRAKAIIDTVLTITPAAPELTLEEPKADA